MTKVISKLALVEQLLVARGYKTAGARSQFLKPDYLRDLHDPYLLTDMNQAVERIVLAAKRHEKVIIYGDYDIDGITASAVMLEGIAAIGGQATSYIPDRFEEGYGINLEALKALKDQGVGLIISVDCGVTSVIEAQWAKDNDLDLIITDHHAVPEIIPNAIAVINPKRPNDRYPFKDLAGVGVAFKVVQALQLRLGKPAQGQEKWLLDLVALGTVCDIVSLTGENRTLVAYGLRVLRKTRRVGLRALADVGGVKVQELTTYHLGFVLGPRMNAAGRLEHASRSLILLQTNDPLVAQHIAGELDELNLKRRRDQDIIFNEAEQQAKQFKDDRFLVLASEEWSHGIVGIVASKLVDKWRKPTLVMQIMGDVTKGSARSVGGYDMIEGFRAVSKHFTKFGGHYFAAGCTLPTNQIDSLRLALNSHYDSLGFTTNHELLAVSDLELDDPGVVDWEFWAELEQLEPYGNGNPRPVFETGQLKILDVRLMGQDKRHYKLKLSSTSGHIIEAVAFGLVERLPDLAVAQIVRIWYHLGRNDWQGRSQLQYIVSHLEVESAE